MKDTLGKPKLGLIPIDALEEIALIREFGIEKYKGDNYKNVHSENFIHATLRHIYKHLQKERIDEESGRLHLSHAATSLMLGLEQFLSEKLHDECRHQNIERRVLKIDALGGEPDRFSMKDIIRAWEEDIKFQTENEPVEGDHNEK